MSLRDHNRQQMLAFAEAAWVTATDPARAASLWERFPNVDPITYDTVEQAFGAQVAAAWAEARVARAKFVTAIEDALRFEEGGSCQKNS